MATPYVETILSAVLAELERIKPVNGYTTFPEYVGRYDRHGGPGEKRPSVVLRYLGDHHSFGAEGGGDLYLVSLRLEVRCQIERDPPVGSDRQISDLAADVRQALASVAYSDIAPAPPEMYTETILEDDPNDPTDGAVIVAIYKYRVSGSDLSMATEGA